jgi:hypothetical protein
LRAWGRQIRPCFPATPLLILIHQFQCRTELLMVDKSRYQNPPKWPPPRQKTQGVRVFWVHQLQRIVAAAMPYVLVTAIVCAVVAWHAHQRLIQ